MSYEPYQQKTRLVHLGQSAPCRLRHPTEASNTRPIVHSLISLLPLQITMNETRRMILINFVHLITAMTEESFCCTIWTAWNDNLLNRKAHLLTKKQSIGRFEICCRNSKTYGFRIGLAMEVGIETKRDLTNHSGNVTAIGRNHMNTITMLIVYHQIFYDL